MVIRVVFEQLWNVVIVLGGVLSWGIGAALNNDFVFEGNGVVGGYYSWHIIVIITIRVIIFN